MIRTRSDWFQAAVCGLVVVVYAVGCVLEPSTIFLRIPDALWCLSWIFIGFRTYRDRSSGYPPELIMIPLTWEFWAFLYFAWAGGMPPFMKFHYFTWLAVSGVFLFFISKYNRREFMWGGNPRWFWAKAAGEFLVFTGLYLWYSRQPGGLRRILRPRGFGARDPDLGLFLGPLDPPTHARRAVLLRKPHADPGRKREHHRRIVVPPRVDFSRSPPRRHPHPRRGLRRPLLQEGEDPPGEGTPLTTSPGLPTVSTC